MTDIRSLCVYCGSRKGPDDSYVEISRNFGTIMAREKISLVYGGGTIGLMGVVAKAVTEGGGSVISVIPGHLDDIEVGYREADEYLVVPDMHSRKKLMFDRSDGFVVLPGGLGTLDEMIEVITWIQLGLHRKPVILVNHDNYWDPFLSLVDHTIALGFAGPSARQFFTVVDAIEDVLPAVRQHLPAEPDSHPELI